MKTTLKTGIATLVVALSLTACSTAIQSQDVPQAGDPVPTATAAPTSEPTAEPTEVDNSESGVTFTIDPASVVVPDEVTAAYSDTGNLVSDTLAVADLANQVKELHAARSGDEIAYWSVYRDSMTPEAYERLVGNVEGAVAGDAEAADRLNGLAPYAERDGVLAQVDGVTYSVGERGVRVDVTNEPTVTLIEDATYGQRVAVDLPLTARAYTDDAHVLVFTMNKVYFMVPGAEGHWVLDGYDVVNASGITVEVA